MSSAYGRRQGRMESARSARAGVLATEPSSSGAKNFDVEYARRLEKALSSAAVRGPGSNTALFSEDRRFNSHPIRFRFASRPTRFRFTSHPTRISLHLSPRPFLTRR